MAQKKNKSFSSFYKRTLILSLISFIIMQALVQNFIHFTDIVISNIIMNLISLAFAVIIYILMTKYMKSHLGKCLLVHKDDFNVSIQLIDALINVIISSIENLRKVVFLITNEPDKMNFNILYRRIQELKNAIYLIKQKNSSIKDNITSKKEFDILVEEIFEEIRNLYSIMISMSSDVLNNLKDFNNNVEFLKDLNEKLITNILKILYNFKTSMPILTDLSKSTDVYTIGIIKKIFDEFKNIANYSDKILENSQDTMNSFIDKENEKSLGHISSETKEIIGKFNSFFDLMMNFKNISNSFLDSSMKSLKEIENTSINIEEISEKIKLISINVRIEASHLGSEKTGFKVLGQEISEFANITSKISKDSHLRVTETITAIQNLKDEYIVRIDDIFNYIESLQKTFTPFENIINTSFDKIKVLIEDLNKLSHNINNNIKESIGKLQYYDVTSQELSHIVSYINYITDFANYSMQDFDVTDRISQDEMNEINNYIIENFKKILTTENERKVIESYIEKFGLQTQDVLELDEKLKDSKIVDEGTILF